MLLEARTLVPSISPEYRACLIDVIDRAITLHLSCGVARLHPVKICAKSIVDCIESGVKLSSEVDDELVGGFLVSIIRPR